MCLSHCIDKQNICVHVFSYICMYMCVSVCVWVCVKGWTTEPGPPGSLEIFTQLWMICCTCSVRHTLATHNSRWPDMHTEIHQKYRINTVYNTSVLCHNQCMSFTFIRCMCICWCLFNNIWDFQLL